MLDNSNFKTVIVKNIVSMLFKHYLILDTNVISYN